MAVNKSAREGSDQDILSSKCNVNDLRFWSTLLSGRDNFSIPVDRLVRDPGKNRVLRSSFDIDEKLSLQLRNLATCESKSLNTVLLSAFYVALSALSGQHDIVIGNSLNDENNGNNSALDLVPLRVQVQSDISVVSLIHHIDKLITNVQQYRSCSFDQLNTFLASVEGPSLNPIFQIKFAVKSVDSLKNEQEKLDLSLIIDDSHKQLTGQFYWAEAVFDVATLDQLVAVYQQVLVAIVDNQYQPIGKLPLLPEKDRQRLNHWNETTASFPDEKTLSQLFEEQVAKTPTNTAVIFADEKLSYAELNAKANALARTIRARYRALTHKELEPDTLIPLYLERSAEMIVSILAILKAGGAYVPVSPEYPSERVRFMLRDTKARVVLTQSGLLEKLKKAEIEEDGNEITYLSVDDPTLTQGEEQTNLPQISGPKDLAYVIYTSGTTGQPKGAMLEHRGVVNRIFWMQQTYPLCESDRVLQKTPYVFDVSVWELLWANWTGACIVVASPEVHKDPQALRALIARENITHLHFVPSMLGAFNQHLIETNQRIPSCVKCVFASGEALTEATVIQFKDVCAQQTELHNLYGPTEASVDVTAYDCRSASLKVIPIGKPINNIKLYVLNESMNLVPLGAPGELYLGGIGLARGYLNREELSTQRFVANPFADEQDREKGYTRLYKTGDLVRWRNDGELEYLGRNDFQVKIRGFRIEPGEIENALMGIDDVQQVAVIAHGKEANSYLVAYVVPTQGKTLSESDLRDALLKVLPEYMVPSVFITLQKLPLTINGKLDRKGLPTPEEVRNRIYEAPGTEIERELCQLWEEILGVSQIGMTDNFFRLGGNSITTVKLSAVIQNRYKKNIPLSQLFNIQDIKTLSSILHDAPIETLNIPPSPQPQILSFAQERMLFIERSSGGTCAYHIPLLVKLKGDVKLDVLTDSLSYLQERHQILKTVYRTNDQGHDYQTLIDIPLSINSVVIHDDNEWLKRVKKDASQLFDLSNEHPVRYRHYIVGDEQYLLMVWHHIAFDGWSTDIFLSELAQVYTSYLHASEPDLPELPIQYVDFAYWQRESLVDEDVQLHLSYWQEVLSGYENLAFPADKPRPAQFDDSGKEHHFLLSGMLSNSLRELAKNEATTLNTVMLGALYVSLAVMSGHHDIVIGIPSDGRHYIQTQPLIGFFVNSLPIRINENFSVSVRELIASLHTRIIAAKSHQDLPFDRLVSELSIENDLSRHPVFQVMFAVQSFGQYRAENLPFIPVTLSQNQSLAPAAKFDISLIIDDSHEQLRGQFCWAEAVFDDVTMTQLIAVYQQVLVAFVGNKHQPVGELPLLPEEDKQRLDRWNDTTASFPADKTLSQLFEEQVVKTPENTAVIFADEKLSYAELNAKANALARTIRTRYRALTNKELEPDTLIPLYLERSAEMIISILAVLKAGAAYVPVSPEYPSERVRFMLSDTKARVVLTQSGLLEKIKAGESGNGIVYLSVDDPTLTQDIEQTNLPAISGPKNLAYVIYTSGTTGQPKGVMIEQNGVVNLLHSQRQTMCFSDDEKVLGLAPYVFDASIEQIFLPVLSGGCFIMASDADLKDVEKIKHFAFKYQVTHIHATPDYLLSLGSLNELMTLRRVISGGDRCHAQLKSLFGEKLNNEYGPTETTVTSLNFINYPNCRYNGGIGKPIANTKLYVLSPQMKRLPVGALGELYISGAGVARGYLNRDELSAQRFVENPFADEHDKEKGYTRLYKTGDLVRWRGDGELEYLGRNDCQLKIRGFRIEPGEIENTLMDIDDVQQVAVIAHGKETNSYLVAYVVPTQGKALSESNLRDALVKVLPEYMVPSLFITLEKLPLTINGKLDRKGLPAPGEVRNGDYEAPEREIERKLCQIWQEVLGVGQVGINDNFFHIGGNSLSAVRLVAKMNTQMPGQMKVRIRDIFRHKTIAILLKSLEKTTEVTMV
ncbi:non-ribosomal peptide synthetase [Photorhabdus australis]|uniref:non-ribosomal peptide synthetase n=1 Tax=Photorhabdus australis TaxID=286156 RepID=UPI000689E931|nr:non-ribosomal peptide synthetase [Photorhabdus australis]